MSDNVTPLRKDVVTTSDKQQFLDYVAKCYDDFVAHGSDPITLAFGFVDEKGAASAHWLCINEADNKPKLYVPRAFQIIENVFNNMDAMDSCEHDHD